MADASDDIVGGRLTFFHRQDFYRVSLVVRSQNQMIVGRFYIFHRTGFVFANGIHVEFAFAIRLERVVMAVNE